MAAAHVAGLDDLQDVEPVVQLMRRLNSAKTHRTKQCSLPVDNVSYGPVVHAWHILMQTYQHTMSDPQRALFHAWVTASAEPTYAERATRTATWLADLPVHPSKDATC